MITIDGRCHCKKCESRTGDIYRMVGYCSICHTTDILILYRSGDKVYAQDCIVCGNYYSITVFSQRKATIDEIPVA